MEKPNCTPPNDAKVIRLPHREFPTVLPVSASGFIEAGAIHTLEYLDQILDDHFQNEKLAK